MGSGKAPWRKKSLKQGGTRGERRGLTPDRKHSTDQAGEGKCSVRSVQGAGNPQSDPGRGRWGGLQGSAQANDGVQTHCNVHSESLGKLQKALEHELIWFRDNTKQW